MGFPYVVTYLGGEGKHYEDDATGEKVFIEPCSGYVLDVSNGKIAKIETLEQAEDWWKLFHLDESGRWKFKSHIAIIRCIRYLSKKGNIT